MSSPDSCTARIAVGQPACRRGATATGAAPAAASSPDTRSPAPSSRPSSQASRSAGGPCTITRGVAGCRPGRSGAVVAASGRSQAGRRCHPGRRMTRRSRAGVRHELRRASRPAGSRRPGRRGGSPLPTAASPAPAGRERGPGQHRDLRRPGIAGQAGRLGGEGDGGPLHVGGQLRPRAPGAGLDVGRGATAGSRTSGSRVPVRAQRSRLPSPSALRAMCVSTCPRLQPGSRDGSRIWASVSVAADAEQAVRRLPDAGQRLADLVVHAMLPCGPGPSGLPVSVTILAHGMAGWEGTRRIPRRAGEGISGAPFLSVPPDTMTCPPSAERPHDPESRTQWLIVSSFAVRASTT